MPDAFRCPYCRAEYETKFVVCVRCGMNLKTGRHEEIAVGGDDEEDAEAGPSKARVAAVWVAVGRKVMGHWFLNRLMALMSIPLAN